MRTKLRIGHGKIHALKDRQGNTTINFDDIAKAAEKFHSGLYSTQRRHAIFIRSSDEEDTDAPSITSDEVKTSFQAMTQRKAAGEDGITVD